VSAAAAGVIIWMHEPRPVTLRGHLTEFGTTSMKFGIEPDGGISPACGCMIPPINDWRGVTFTSHAITITRRSPAPWTAYQISLAEPEPIAAFEQGTFLQGSVIRAQVSGNPSAVALGASLLKDSHNIKILTHRNVVTNIVQLMTRQPLHIALLGPVPVGAWIPLPGSSVVLSSQANVFDDETPEALLTEHYTSREGVNAANRQAQHQGYPLGDFLGPKLVLWTTDPMASAPVGGLVPPRSSPPNSEDVVTAVVIRTGDYAARVTATPVTANIYSKLLPSLRGREGAAGDYVITPPLDRGTIELSDDAPLRAYEYRHLRASVQHNPDKGVTLRSNLAFESKPINRYSPDDDITEVFAYPPLPPDGGFNVFGPLSELDLSSARGAISASGREIALEAPSNVTMTDVKSLSDSRTGQQLVQVPLYTTQADANLNFTGVGQLSVDGAPETLRANNYTGTLSGIVDGIAVLSLLIGVLGLWYAVRNDLRTVETQRQGDPPAASAD
jgi:hypothetical protein